MTQANVAVLEHLFVHPPLFDEVRSQLNLIRERLAAKPSHSGRAACLNHIEHYGAWEDEQPLFSQATCYEEDSSKF